MDSEHGFRRHLASYQVLMDAASNTAVRMPSRPSMRFRPKFAEGCAKSGPITTPRFGEGGGPDTRSCAIQALRGIAFARTAAELGMIPSAINQATRGLRARIGAMLLLPGNVPPSTADFFTHSKDVKEHLLECRVCRSAGTGGRGNALQAGTQGRYNAENPRKRQASVQHERIFRGNDR